MRAGDSKVVEQSHQVAAEVHERERALVVVALPVAPRVPGHRRGTCSATAWSCSVQLVRLPPIPCRNTTKGPVPAWSKAIRTSALMRPYWICDASMGRSLSGLRTRDWVARRSALVAAGRDTRCVDRADRWATSEDRKLQRLCGAPRPPRSSRRGVGRRMVSRSWPMGTRRRRRTQIFPTSYALLPDSYQTVRSLGHAGKYARPGRRR